MEFAAKHYPSHIKLAVTSILTSLLVLLSAEAKAQSSESEYKEQATQTILSAFRSGDLDEIEKVLSLSKLARKVGAKLFDKPSEVNGFVQGFTHEDAKKRFVASSFTGVVREGTHISYRSLREMDNQIYPLIRLDIAEGGHEYILLDVIMSGAEKGKVQDMFVASSGKWSSDSIADASKLLLI